MNEYVCLCGGNTCGYKNGNGHVRDEVVKFRLRKLNKTSRRKRERKNELDRNREKNARRKVKEFGLKKKLRQGDRVRKREKLRNKTDKEEERVVVRGGEGVGIWSEKDELYSQRKKTEIEREKKRQEKSE